MEVNGASVLEGLKAKYEGNVVVLVVCFVFKAIVTCAGKNMCRNAHRLILSYSKKKNGTKYDFS